VGLFGKSTKITDFSIIFIYGVDTPTDIMA